jgi:serine/threonine protein kinase
MPDDVAPGEKQRSLTDGQLLCGRYRIRRLLAVGGMGEVYEADDLELGDRIAVKALKPQFAGDETALKRFRREIHLARKVTHPNVCRLFDLQHHGDVVFLTMELLVGETLAERVRRRGQMRFDDALDLTQQMAAALDAAHAAGVIHRDFKSDNVVLVPCLTGRGRVRAVVTDFGLARSSAKVWHSGVRGIVGTPAYMAPEQVKGGDISVASDVYALAVVVFEMVTGELPFSGHSPLEVAMARTRQAPRDPAQVRKDLPVAWAETIQRGLERDAKARFRSAGALAAALRGRHPARRWMFAAAAALGFFGAGATALHFFIR